MCMFCLHVCLCSRCVPGTCRDQKSVSDPLELELRMVVSHHVDVGTQTWNLCKSKRS